MYYITINNTLLYLVWIWSTCMNIERLCLVKLRNDRGICNKLKYLPNILYNTPHYKIWVNGSRQTSGLPLYFSLYSYIVLCISHNIRMYKFKNKIKLTVDGFLIIMLPIFSFSKKCWIYTYMYSWLYTYSSANNMTTDKS